MVGFVGEAHWYVVSGMHEVTALVSIQDSNHYVLEEKGKVELVGAVENRPLLRLML